MESITVEQLKARMEAGDQLNLVDVREDSEHAEFNLGGIHVRLRRIQEMAIEDIEDLKNEEVICYCRRGNRSQSACLILEHMGFNNTKNMVGGVEAWVEKFGNKV